MIVSGKYLGDWNYDLQDEPKCLLVFAFLHKKKIISDDKLKGMMSTLRKGTFIRKVNTYHSDINDRWYDHESTAQLIYDLIKEEYLEREEISLLDFIYYINLLHNKNHNWCINYYYLKYVLPTLTQLRNWNAYSIIPIVDAMKGGFHINEFTRRSSDYYCCCGCCCGFYSYSYEEDSHLQSEQKRVRQEIINELNKMKKGRWKLAPYQLSV